MLLRNRLLVIVFNMSIVDPVKFVDNLFFSYRQGTIITIVRQGEINLFKLSL